MPVSGQHKGSEPTHRAHEPSTMPTAAIAQTGSDCPLGRRRAGTRSSPAPKERRPDLLSDGGVRSSGPRSSFSSVPSIVVGPFRPGGSFVTRRTGASPRWARGWPGRWFNLPLISRVIRTGPQGRPGRASERRAWPWLSSGTQSAASCCPCDPGGIVTGRATARRIFRKRRRS